MNTIIDKIEDMVWYITDPRMDGFSQFGKKQMLYNILWKTQWALDRCPTFYGEQEWIKQNCPK